ncbi:MAG: amidase family protein [Candidatus Aenigmatarchaeota archaeon]
MSYKISVREFLQLSRNGSMDYNDFSAKLAEEIKRLGKYNFFRHVAELNGKAEENLFGLPISVKDNICVKGMPSSAGSKILEDYIPPFDATSVARVRVCGGNVLGKTNQDEFGFGTFSTNSQYGVPKNPLDPDRSCGGSSGGAAGLTSALAYPHVALAESTGGSISCPASFCSVVGLTPTYGLVSRYGLIDYANSLDKIGPIGKSVYDVALLLTMIAGHDNRDSTSITQHQLDAKGISACYDYTKHANKTDLKKIRIGVPKEYFKNVDKRVEKSVWKAIKRLEGFGAKIQKISLPYTKYALSSYYIIATAEASTNLSKYCGMRYGLHLELDGNFNEYFSKVRSKGFGDEAKRRIMLGTFCRMSGYRDAYYMKAMRVRTLIIQDFQKAFKKCDVIAAPTMPILPPKFTEIEKLTPIEQYQMDVLTVPANLAGIPMISLPCDRMVGLHLLGNHLSEAKLIEVASAFEGEK